MNEKLTPEQREPSELGRFLMYLKDKGIEPSAREVMRFCTHYNILTANTEPEDELAIKYGCSCRVEYCEFQVPITEPEGSVDNFDTSKKRVTTDPEDEPEDECSKPNWSEEEWLDVMSSGPTYVKENMNTEPESEPDRQADFEATARIMIDFVENIHPLAGRDWTLKEFVNGYVIPMQKYGVCGCPQCVQQEEKDGKL